MADKYRFGVDLFHVNEKGDVLTPGVPFRRLTFAVPKAWADRAPDWTAFKERVAKLGYEVSGKFTRGKLGKDWDYRAVAYGVVDRGKGHKPGRIGTLHGMFARGPGPDTPAKGRNVIDWPLGRPDEIGTPAPLVARATAAPQERPRGKAHSQQPQQFWRLSLYEHDDGRIAASNYPFRRVEFAVRREPDKATVDAKLAKVGYRVSGRVDRRAKLKEFGGEYDWMTGSSLYHEVAGGRLSRHGDMERAFAIGPGPDEPVKSVSGIKVIDWPNGRPPQKKSPTENPAWVDKAIRANWDMMEAEVGAELMPQERKAAPKSGAFASRYDELGYGHYGAVFTTRKKNVVCKITSDPDEVRFILAAMSLGKWPAGVVRYYDLMRLEGAYRKRAMYAIWREEAVSTGDILPEATKPGTRYYKDAKIEFGALLYVFLLFARQVRERGKRLSLRNFQHEVAQADDMDVWDEAMQRFGQMLSIYQRSFARRQAADTPRMPYRGVMRTAVALKVCHIAAEQMAYSYGAVDVGSALAFYLDHGILLADVHTFNLGQVRRGKTTRTVITDPGHSVFLTPKFDRLLTAIKEPESLRRRVKKLPRTTPNPGAFRRLMKL